LTDYRHPAQNLDGTMTLSTTDEPYTIDRRRYRKILSFFTLVIAHVLWWDFFLGRFLGRRVRSTRPVRFRRLARRFRELAVEMGGVMIKLGQFLSSRADVLPPEITEELSGLQDEVPPVPLAEVMAVLAAELGDVGEHFARFEPEPVAAASLGQAHRAWLAPGAAGHLPAGQSPVIVKVQRLGIDTLIRTDLAALQVVARWFMRYGPIRRRANVPALLEEFAATLWEEVDYVAEAGNAERFGLMFAADPGIRIPAVYREHSTGRVLVLEDVSGIKITDVALMDAAGVDRGEVAQRLLDAYFLQIFKEGFFHADPHPGNLFVIPDESAPNGRGQPFQLSFVDFGMVGHVEELMGDNLRRVLVGLTKRDARDLTEAYNELGFFLPGADLERIAAAQEEVLDKLWGRNLLQLNQVDPREFQVIGREFRDLLFEFPFQIPQDFIYLGRAMGLLSGLSTMLDPTINPWHLAERYGRQIVSAEEIWSFSRDAVLRWARMYLALPMQASRVLTAAEEGKLRVRAAPDRQMIRRLEHIERRAGRPNWSIVSAAFVLSGTLLYLGGEPLLALAAWGLGALTFAVSIVRGGL
jgi:predicted unusual protein kinase regulating ubiquinone biosynthesis (AarF/ABC1/UbiB family)